MCTLLFAVLITLICTYFAVQIKKAIKCEFCTFPQTELQYVSCVEVEMHMDH